MKIFFGTLILLAFLNGCNDGDLILETINFEKASTQLCNENNIIYKLNENEALLLEIPLSSFKNEPTPTGKPIEITISSINRVVYRFYNGKVSADNICETIQPATPVVIDQWIATGGTIQITTTTKKTTNPANNSTKITGFNHTIIFKNITFQKSNGIQVYESFVFGDYATSITPLPIDFKGVLNRCTTNSPNTIYNFNGNESLVLEIDPNLIISEVTPLNSPRIGLIGNSNNSVTYKLYNGLLSSSYFCNASIPTTPLINEEWLGISGVSGISGIIEVTSTTNGTGYKHTIVFKKVSLTNGNTDFYLGDSYFYGELLTN